MTPHSILNYASRYLVERTSMKRILVLVCCIWLGFPTPPSLATPASVPPASAPQMAHLGTYAVGMTEVQWQTPGRTLRVMIWYPSAAPGHPMRYAGVLPAIPGLAASSYTTEALATRDAVTLAEKRPTIFFSHGFGSKPERHAWLGENLASKGYVVIAPDHGDRAYTQPGAFAEALIHRAPDLAGVANAAFNDSIWSSRIDRTQLGLIGYSMGGYGALRVAGAAFNSSSAITRVIPRGALDAQLAGGALDHGPMIAGLKGVVLLAPWGGQAEIGAFSPATLAKVATPTMLIGGDRDDISGYENGVVTLFSDMTQSARILVTFENGGHTFAADVLPPEGQGVFLYEEFFEDPVWRKDRLHAVSQHFITAFLDLNVKGDESRAAFLELPDGRSADGIWPQPPGAASTGAFSSGQPNVSIWRGFQRRWAEGLRYRAARPAHPQR